MRTVTRCNCHGLVVVRKNRAEHRSANPPSGQLLETASTTTSGERTEADTAEPSQNQRTRRTRTINERPRKPSDRTAHTARQILSFGEPRLQRTQAETQKADVAIEISTS